MFVFYSLCQARPDPTPRPELDVSKTDVELFKECGRMHAVT